MSDDTMNGANPAAAPADAGAPAQDMPAPDAAPADAGTPEGGAEPTEETPAA